MLNILTSQTIMTVDDNYTTFAIQDFDPVSNFLKVKTQYFYKKLYIREITQQIKRL